MVIVTPVDQYFIGRQGWPHKDYVAHYLVNVWLIMQFLEDEGLCSNPEYQVSIKPKIKQMASIITEKED